MKKALIAGNFKMNKTYYDTEQYMRELLERLKRYNFSDRDVILCPPFTALYAVAKEIRNSQQIYLGAQNVHSENSGAFTGEISTDMLLDIGCKYVIIGHSERRHIFKEDDKFINAKVKTALDSSLKVILCVGELIDDREAGIANTVVKNQIENGLANISNIENLIIAYEPVWAIGTGKTAKPSDAQDMHSFIRKTVASLFDKNTANKLIIQYGGSVKPESIKELMSMEDIDGVLVGGACLEVSSFIDIINF